MSRCSRLRFGRLPQRRHLRSSGWQHRRGIDGRHFRELHGLDDVDRRHREHHDDRRLERRSHDDEQLGHGSTTAASSTSSSTGSTTGACQPNGDATITRAELPLRPDSTRSTALCSMPGFDVAGTAQDDGGTLWDFDAVLAAGTDDSSPPDARRVLGSPRLPQRLVHHAALGRSGPARHLPDHRHRSSCCSASPRPPAAPRDRAHLRPAHRGAAVPDHAQRELEHRLLRW